MTLVQTSAWRATSATLAPGANAADNTAPTGVSLANAITSIAENTSTATRLKVADIVIADDTYGTNVITLSGADAASFEVDGTILYVRAGVVLNYEQKTTFSVKVTVGDASVAGSTPVTVDYTLSLIDVDETPATPVVALSYDTGLSDSDRVTSIGLLAISGGDGTNHVTLSGFIDVYAGAALPQIALLRGGTMNTVANAIGVRRGRPEGLLARLVRAYAQRSVRPVGAMRGTRST